MNLAISRGRATTNQTFFAGEITTGEYHRHPDLATEQESQLTTVRANQTTGLTNGRAVNWAPEAEFSLFRAISRRQMTFPFYSVAN